MCSSDLGTVQGLRRRRSIQGGCLGLTRGAALRILESRRLLDAGFALTTDTLFGETGNPYLGPLRARHRKTVLTGASGRCARGWESRCADGRTCIATTGNPPRKMEPSR